MSYEFGGRMGESVEVVTSELHLAADRLRGAGQRLQDGLSAVDLETSNLLASGWKGEAATAFDKYWEQWHNGAGQVVRALQTMSEALDTAATNYQAADEQAGGALGSTMQAGGGSGAATGGGGAPTAGGAPTGAGAPGAEVTGGSTGSTSGLAEQMNLGETMAPMSQAAGIPAQVAGQVAGGLMQAGTMAAGAAQQAVQAATQLAQEAQAAAAEQQAVEAGPEKPDSEAATGGDAPAGPAPVEAPRAGADASGPEETPGRSL
ncbi:WXG100 family type VII secretion target [Mycolicibacterium frederiksbergense]